MKITALEKKISFIVSVLLFTGSISCLYAGGAEESAASSSRGKYLAGIGVIIPPEEVHINSYIASIDYTYPDPSDDIGITLYSGHRQISVSGQQELIQVGIQGKRKAFEDLTPLNLAFVIDKSGSMEEQDKMGWVKDSFDYFINKVRDVDFVSLIVFDNDASVIFPSTRMDSPAKREEFRKSVRSISPGGGTNLSDGLENGYAQVMANYRKEYTNRVLFLTDGVGESTGILEMADSYRELGINVSTIGVGKNFDVQLMVDLAKRGGGSSRFISDREEMEKIFSSEFSRMVAPVARDLEMELNFPSGSRIIDTWGYENKPGSSKISYSQSTLHLGDYETILALIETPEGLQPGRHELARFTVSYKTMDGTDNTSGPHILNAEFVDARSPVSGITAGKVLRSGTMLHFAQGLIDIGESYYSSEGFSGEGRAEYLRKALNITSSLKKEVLNARLRLDDTGFDDELEILDRYIGIIGSDLEIKSTELDEIRSDREIPTPAPERSLQDHLSGLLNEMTLDLAEQNPGTIAVSGFTAGNGEAMPLLDLINSMAVTEISQMGSMKVVERSNLDSVLEEQKLSLSGLMDTTAAIKIGKLLTADYILTGSLIEMPNTYVVFGRIINVETSEIESAAQIIMPRTVLQQL